MKELFLKNVKPGMILAKPVLSPQGKIIGNAGDTVNAALLNKLAFHSIQAIVIEDPPSTLQNARNENSKSTAKPETAAPKTNTPKTAASNTATQHAPAPHAKSYSQQVKQSPEFQKFQSEYAKQRASCKKTFAEIEQGGSVEIDSLYAQTRELMKTMHTTIQIFDMLHNVRQVDDSIYAHSLNVALISFSMGTWLKFCEHDLKILTISGLLHDIGKIKIPTEILEKPGKYTDEEFELVKSHPRLGYEILKDLDIDDRIKKSALMHHERCDGSGYPAGIEGEYINDFSLIVAIADVYDAMTAARTYRAPLCPFQVIESFEKEGLHKYKPKYILTFLQRIANAYQSNRVLLSNGKSGNIVLINDKSFSKPIVDLGDGKFLDLSTQPDLSIVSVL